MNSNNSTGNKSVKHSKITDSVIDNELEKSVTKAIESQPELDMEKKRKATIYSEKNTESRSVLVMINEKTTDNITYQMVDNSKVVIGSGLKTGEVLMKCDNSVIIPKTDTGKLDLKIFSGYTFNRLSSGQDKCDRSGSKKPESSGPVSDCKITNIRKIYSRPEKLKENEKQEEKKGKHTKQRKEIKGNESELAKIFERIKNKKKEQEIRRKK